MPGLPGRPDLDQLRRQARDLLRAAVSGEQAAIARIYAVSPQLTLSAAQLALAREYGFRSWPVLRAEAERRRQTALAEARSPAGGTETGPPPAFKDRRSFGGATAIETLTGRLSPEGLVADAGQAVLFARLTPWEALEMVASGRPASGLLAQDGDGSDRETGRSSFSESLNVMEALAQVGDITIVDDQGTSYTLRRRGTYGPSSWAWADFQFGLDPVPGPNVRWLELSGQSGTVTRLLASACATARAGDVMPVTGSPAERELSRRANSVMAHWLDAPAGSRDSDVREACASLLAMAAEARQAGTLNPASELAIQVARLVSALTAQGPTSGLPAAWAGMLAAADEVDGSRSHFDLGITVPTVAGVTIRLDALISAPGHWRLHLRSAGKWPVQVLRDGNGNLTDKWRNVEITAADDHGNSYVSSFSAFASGANGIQESSLTFRPRLDPFARRLALTITGPADQITLGIEPGPAPRRSGG